MILIMSMFPILLINMLFQLKGNLIRAVTQGCLKCTILYNSVLVIHKPPFLSKPIATELHYDMV